MIDELDILEAIPDWMIQTEIPSWMVPTTLLSQIPGIDSDLIDTAVNLFNDPNVRQTALRYCTNILTEQDASRAAWEKTVNWLESLDENSQVSALSVQSIRDQANELIRRVDRLDAQLERFGIQRGDGISGLGVLPAGIVLGLGITLIIVAGIVIAVIAVNNSKDHRAVMERDTDLARANDLAVRQQIIQAQERDAQRTGRPLALPPSITSSPSAAQIEAQRSGENTSSAINTAVNGLITVAAIGVGGLLLIKALPALTGGSKSG